MMVDAFDNIFIGEIFKMSDSTISVSDNPGFMLHTRRVGGLLRGGPCAEHVCHELFNQISDKSQKGRVTTSVSGLWITSGSTSGTF